MTPAELLGGLRYPAGLPEGQAPQGEGHLRRLVRVRQLVARGAAVPRRTCTFPADLYLEGSDQHRGWFQLSLLPSLGATGAAAVQAGADARVRRQARRHEGQQERQGVRDRDEGDRTATARTCCGCGAASVDYQGDIPASPQVIKEFGDKYRKIRNTLRYLLTQPVRLQPARPTRRRSRRTASTAGRSAELDALIRDVTAAYDAYQLHRAFRLLHDFCAVQISAVYGNAMKDRLYCEAPDSPLRRRSQTVMHRMVVALTKLLAPMLVFTADEAWEHIHAQAGRTSETLAERPPGAAAQAVAATRSSDEQREEWKLLMELRDEALLQLDELKKEAGLNKALDAEVVYHVDDDELRRRLQAYGVGPGRPRRRRLPHLRREAGRAEPAVQVKVLDRRETYQACAELEAPAGCRSVAGQPELWALVTPPPSRRSIVRLQSLRPRDVKEGPRSVCFAGLLRFG